MEKWSYKVLSFPRTGNESFDIRLEDSFDKLGKEGWELVAFDFATHRAVFKRRFS